MDLKAIKNYLENKYRSLKHFRDKIVPTHEILKSSWKNVSLMQ